MYYCATVSHVGLGEKRKLPVFIDVSKLYHEKTHEEETVVYKSSIYELNSNV